MTSTAPQITSQHPIFRFQDQYNEFNWNTFSLTRLSNDQFQFNAIVTVPATNGALSVTHTSEVMNLTQVSRFIDKVLTESKLV